MFFSWLEWRKAVPCMLSGWHSRGLIIWCRCGPSCTYAFCGAAPTGERRNCYFPSVCPTSDKNHWRKEGRASLCSGSDGASWTLCPSWTGRRGVRSGRQLVPLSQEVERWKLVLSLPSPSFRPLDPQPRDWCHHPQLNLSGDILRYAWRWFEIQSSRQGRLAIPGQVLILRLPVHLGRS